MWCVLADLVSMSTVRTLLGSRVTFKLDFVRPIQHGVYLSESGMSRMSGRIGG